MCNKLSVKYSGDNVKARTAASRTRSSVFIDGVLIAVPG